MHCETAAEGRYLALAGHCGRVSDLVESLAHELGLDPRRARAVGVASRLHDFGKIAVPDEILLKPGRLTAVERSVMERHTEVGYELLAETGSSLMDTAALIALTHHEHWDGSGYPRGLRGRQIPIEGRIVAVADVYDALTHRRCYRGAFTRTSAVETVRKGSGGHFDPRVVDAFLRVRP
jgi:HD-GYP domain-containing protein (c-di-GMP phosphodiesterase class II)